MTKTPSQLQRELSQSRPFRSRQQEAGIALVKTADNVRRHFASVIEPHGITPQQFNVLRILRGAGDGGMPTLEIARRMIERTPGITRLLDRLEAKRLVRRQRCATDRRQMLCWIDPPGLALLDALEEPVAHAERTALRGLPERDLKQLIRLLDALRREVE